MGKKSKKQNKFLDFLAFSWPYIAIIAILSIVLISYNAKTNSRNKTFYELDALRTELKSENVTSVESITVSEKETVIDITGKYKKTENNKEVYYTFTAELPIVTTSDIPEFDATKAEVYEFLYSFNTDSKEVVKISYAFQTSIWTTLLIYVLPTVLTVVVMIIIMKRMTGKNSDNARAFDFGKSRAKNIENSKVRFADVAGCDEEKAEMAEIVDYLKDPRKFTTMGARVPKGIILKGQPGTGKTLLAKAVAGEAKVPFLSISGSDFVEMFVGVGASRVRDMFNTAKQNAPCIVFIDEIDAVGRQRGSGIGGGHDEREQTLNQLLVEMDGFEDNSGIIVMAATNRPDVLDPALLRPGRFDRQIIVDLPDKKGRTEILKVHARNKKFASDVDFANIATRTPGFSGAELENVLNEAAILAVRENKTEITINNIDEAIDRVMGGPAKKSRVISEREKKLVAYHEAGHTIVGLKLESAMKVQKVTIIPRGEAGGYVLMTPTDDRMLSTKTELLEEISGLLAGRCSEEIFFNDVTSGAQNDIEKATKIARMMVTNLGMSSLGPIQYEQPQGNVFLGRDYANAARNVSGEIAYEIDNEIKKIIDQSMKVTNKIINDNKEKVALIAETLIKKETLNYEEIMQLMNNGKLNEEGEEKK